LPFFSSANSLFEIMAGMAYDSDSDDLFHISWHRPTSVRDAFTQCCANAGAACFLCIIYSLTPFIAVWECRPWERRHCDCRPWERRSHSEGVEWDRLKQLKRYEKLRARAEKQSLKMAPVPLPLKRKRVLELPLPGPGGPGLPPLFRKRQVTHGQLQSLFFRLPLEIRETIYEYSFLAGNPGFVIHVLARQRRLGHLCGMQWDWDSDYLRYVDDAPVAPPDLPLRCTKHSNDGFLALLRTCRGV
jgi:hypothetical protein